MNADAWLDRIRTFDLRPDPSRSQPRPRLLYDADEAQALSACAQRSLEEESKLGQWVKDVCQQAEQIAAGSPDRLAQRTEPFYVIPSLDAVCTAYLLTGNERLVGTLEQIVEHFLDHPDWVAHVHVNMSYDHAAANTAAAVARVLEALAAVLSPQRIDELGRRLVERAVDPFVHACRAREIFWTQRAIETNWRIMTCGETGMAVLATIEQNPNWQEALLFAAEGVLDSFDKIAPEGDWPEGLNYWLTTLGFGLRFAEALRRMSNGELDLFQHPSLPATADYIAQLFKQDGTVYNFNDNHPTADAESIGSLFLFSHRLNRPDCAWVAALNDSYSVLRLLVEDKITDVHPPEALSACYRRTGVAVFRNTWEATGSFVGFKSGPSDVGHCHLDANSFVLSLNGVEFVHENGYWPADHFNGFFERPERRWNFDANGTVGHNTILVEGHGQTYGPDGRIVHYGSTETHGWVLGDATDTYPLLTRFWRWLLFIHDGLVVVFDEIAAEEPRHVEWLLHCNGTFSGGLSQQVVTNGEQSATLTWVFPEDQRLWRVSDTTRTTYYEGSNIGKIVSPQVCYRTVGPIHRTERIETVMLLAAGGPDAWRVNEKSLDEKAVKLALTAPSGVDLMVVLDRVDGACSVERSP